MDPAASTSAPAPAPAAAASRDVAAMPDSPPRLAARHRRAQSEILLGGALPDDLAFDADLGVVGEVGGDDEDEDEYEDDEEGGGGGSQMFEMFLDAGGRLAEPTGPAPHPSPQSLLPPARPRHQHSMSMDGSTYLASAAAGVAGRAAADAKKAISDAKLAELALVDPKRAKRRRLPPRRAAAAASRDPRPSRRRRRPAVPRPPAAVIQT